MTSIKIGKSIKELRIKNDITQDDLSIKLNYSIKSISDWENDKSIPNVDILNELASIFNVSLDELLEGKKQKNFKEEYFTYNQDWLFENKSDDLYSLNQEQAVKIASRFKELLVLFINDELSLCDEKELNFLYNNFYKKDDLSYISFKQHIYEITKKSKNLEEKLFEINKHIELKIKLDIYDVSDYILNKNQVFEKRFKKLEFYKKDMLLNSLCEIDPIYRNIDKFGENSIKRFEKDYNRDFDKEKITKDIIKWLIKNGACLNKLYLTNIGKIEKIKIIDEIESLYTDCKKPIECIEIKDGIVTRYQIANTKRNRFLISYYGEINYALNYAFEALFNIVNTYDEPTNEMIMQFAKDNNINTNREFKYIKADATNKLALTIKKWKEFKDNEKSIKEKEEKLNELLIKLNNGETFIDERKIKKIDLNDKYIYLTKQSSLKEIKEKRETNKTKELLNEIDNLSLHEIKDKYFKVEAQYEQHRF